MFLKRPIYDANTRTWKFEDGTGVVPDELRTAMEMEVGSGRGSWLRAWSKRWEWAERMKSHIIFQTKDDDTSHN